MIDNKIRINRKYSENKSDYLKSLNAKTNKRQFQSF